MRRTLAIIVLGLLVLGYGQFVMPVTVEETSCDRGFTEVENCPDESVSTYDVENGDRDPVRAGGAIVFVAGLFLLVGD